jgi:hypothetical protein
MQALSPAPIQVSISLLEKMPGILEQLLHDASPEVMQWKPAPERWSIQEVLAHLAVIEQLYSEGVCRIVMEEDPALARYFRKRSPAEDSSSASGTFHRLALRTRCLPANRSRCAGRTGRHYEMRSISMSQLLHELANHDLGHLPQLAGLYRAHTFYPHAGSFQKFSHPKP